MSSDGRLRIGIDLGGTKIEGAAFDDGGSEVRRLRIPTPRGDYQAGLDAIRGLVAALEEGASQATVGLGIPGSISPMTGRVQNANSTWLNGQAFDADLERTLGRPVRIANDANCFALSEAVDGAGAAARVVLGIILGTGCGSGIVIDGTLVEGRHRAGGEWGHNPLPWPRDGEWPGPQCWCGRHGCMETWVSGPALAADHTRITGEEFAPEAIVARAISGDAKSAATLARHAERLARGLAHVANIIDPDVIVLGGGLSELAHLYEVLPALIAQHIFADAPSVTVLPPRWGATGGTRGAAWLWNER